MDRRELIDFVRARGLGVIASRGPDGSPQAALVGIAATDEGEIVLDCSRGSRKYANIEHDPAVALVVGWDDEVTVQVEGSAQILGGADLERCKAAYFEQYPDGRDPGRITRDRPHRLDPAVAALLRLSARHLRQLRDAVLTVP